MFRNSNPTLKVFDKPQTWDDFYGGKAGGSAAAAVAVARPTTMTIQGAVTKTLILLGLCTLSAVGAWAYFALNGGITRQAGGAALALLASGGLVGFILAWIMYFNPMSARFLAPVYAVMEGLFVGTVSVAYAANIKWGPGIVLQAGILTFAVLGVLLLAYKARIIVVTSTMWRVVTAATGGVFLFFITCLLLNLIGLNVGYLWSWGPLGLLVGAALVILAALNVVLDFNFIERGAQANLPKAYEWYAGYSLLASLVWLYLETLRLLAMLADRR